MSHWVILLSDNSVHIRSVEPHADDSEVVYCVHCETYSHALAVQGLSLLKATRDFNGTSKYAVLEYEIDEYKATNKRLVDRIDGLLGHQTVLVNLNRACTDLLRRIMSQLAIGTIIQKTHRERNEQSRSIILRVQSVLDKSVDEWLSPPPQDMDDIPF